MPARHLILARHGESAFNAEGRVQGQADAPLSELGRGQAGTLTDLLASLSVDGVVSSTGVAVCGALTVGDRNLGRIGAGLRWGKPVQFMGSSCDVGPWRVAKEAPAPAATRAGLRLQVATGVDAWRARFDSTPAR